MEHHIHDLPDEILEYILDFIPPYKCLRECMVVCRRWSYAVKRVMEHKEAYFYRSIAHGSLEWNSLSSDQSAPALISKRHSHSACIYENSMYVFGGCTRSSTTFNDLWKLDLDTRKWDRPIPMGNYPSPKAGATMIYYKKSFVLFGGWSHPSAYPPHQRRRLFNELHVYCIKTNKWSVIDTLGGPPPTSAHSASIHGNLMVVFGGVSNNYSSSNDVWCLNLENYCWHKQATSETKPHPRYGHSQIELGEKHLLILGGCTGPNAAMNDAWLLTMEGPSWTWSKVNVNGQNRAPTRIWCHQACKVGNHVVVLSQNKQSSKPADMTISHDVANRLYLLPPPRRRQPEPAVDRDENVNGRHGKLVGRKIHVRSPSPKWTVHSASHSLELKCFAAVVLPNAEERRRQANRQRQLEGIQRMEERIQNYRMQQMVKRRTDRLAIFSLDITKVLEPEASATWISHNQNDYNGPDERILYSLVHGKGELIVFGGIRKELITMNGLTFEDDSEVYNDIHFIHPPRYVL